MKKIIYSLLAILALMPLAVAAQNDMMRGKEDKMMKSSNMKTKDIVTTAKKAKMFKTLLKAAKSAGLADTLMNGGPYTIFAPTDEAFAKLPAGTLEKLMMPENKDMLANILKYHIVSGSVMASQVMSMPTAETLSGEEIKIMTDSGKVMLNGSATVIKTDIAASNGVIHVIDTVLMPPAQ